MSISVDDRAHGYFGEGRRRAPGYVDRVTARRLAVVGGGNMGAALVGGLLAAQWAAAAELVVVEVIPARRIELADLFPGVEAVARTVPCQAALIAVKPGDVPGAVRAAVDAGATRILSIAAGVTLATLESAAGDRVAV